MTLDYTKMFLIVTEEAVVKGRFTFTGNEFFRPSGRYFFAYKKPSGGAGGFS